VALGREQNVGRIHFGLDSSSSLGHRATSACVKHEGIVLQGRDMGPGELTEIRVTARGISWG